jgi:hypothetical protein
VHLSNYAIILTGYRAIWQSRAEFVVCSSDSLRSVGGLEWRSIGLRAGLGADTYIDGVATGIGGAVLGVNQTVKFATLACDDGPSIRLFDNLIPARRRASRRVVRFANPAQLLRTLAGASGGGCPTVSAEGFSEAMLCGYAQGVEGATPASVFELSAREYPGEVENPEYPGHFEKRRVRSDGSMRIRGMQLYLSQALGNELVGLVEFEDGHWRVILGSMELATYDERAQELRPIGSNRAVSKGKKYKKKVSGMYPV